MNIENMKMAFMLKKLDGVLTSSEGYLLGVIYGSIVGATYAAQLGQGLEEAEAEELASIVFDNNWQKAQWDQMNESLQLNARSFEEVTKIIGNKSK